MTPPLSTVLDTNILVSSLVFKSNVLRDLREAWQAKSFTPLVCRATILELMRVLTYPKFRMTLAEQKALLAEYLPFCQVVRLPEALPAVPDCRNPFDLPF
ncbi:MAG: putative toxin-antitoxin system toxin component, PIN family [Leptolyngbyaceae cyanobacterium]